MRKRSTSILVLGTVLAVACAGLATANKPETLKAGLLSVKLNGGFKPIKLPKSKPAPIHLNVRGTVNTTDGSRPPALRKAIFKIDKNAAIDAKGLPVCAIGKIVATDTATALRVCRTARVGEGEMESEVAFSNQPPFIVKSHVVAFNGGVRHSKATILIHAFVEGPVPAVSVTVAKVSKIHHGRYGAKLVVTFPAVSGGAGSLRKFAFTFFRMFTYKGKRQGYAQAECPDGKLKTLWKAKFAGGSHLAGSFARPCTPRS